MITETVLEMHYHKPLMDLIRDAFGLGEPGGLNFYKYSPQKEAFIGFDQAYVSTELSDDEFFKVLKRSAMDDGYQLDRIFVGIFLQFKVVKQMQSITKNTPSVITTRPHYRVSLDTTKNLKTGFAQHELLFALNGNPGAFVHYACPMLFDKAKLYEVNVDMSDLRLADISSCPSDYRDNDNHFIFFSDTDSDPEWCSEPVTGTAVSPKQLVQKIVKYANEVEPRTAAVNLLKLIENIEIMPREDMKNLFGESKTPSILPFVSDSLMIVSVPVVQNAKPNKSEMATPRKPSD